MNSADDVTANQEPRFTGVVQGTTHDGHYFAWLDTAIEQIEGFGDARRFLTRK
jgi:hypothetical protein